VLNLETGEPLRKAGVTLTRQGIELKLAAHSVVIGRVVDEDGEAMAGVRIEAMKPVWQGRSRQLVPYGTASTNDLGEYRMWGVAPGAYFFRAGRFSSEFRPVAMEALSDKPEEAYAALWYPNATDSTTAAKVAIRSGAEVRGIDFRMVKTRVFRIRGKGLSATTGNPTTGSVMLFPRGKGYMGWNEMRFAFMADPKQGFEFRNVPPGQYVIRVQTGMDNRVSAVQMRATPTV